MRKYSRTILFSVLFAVVIPIGTLLLFALNGYFDEHERYRVNIDTNADLMIISSEGNEYPQNAILITNTREIKKFLRSYKWRDRHLVCCWSGDNPKYNYTIRLIYEGFYNSSFEETIRFRNDWMVHYEERGAAPYNKNFFKLLVKQIQDFENMENYLYKYMMTAPVVSFENVKTELQDIDNIYIFTKNSPSQDLSSQEFIIVSHSKLDEHKIEELIQKYNVKILEIE
ncbi:MAG: hypothetical protein FWG36_08020 [Oscillospiraceae bacterium]|nr:hypothetical protein [Oscillospiraceae bacterium]